MTKSAVNRTGSSLNSPIHMSSSILSMHCVSECSRWPRTMLSRACTRESSVSRIRCIESLPPPRLEFLDLKVIHAGGSSLAILAPQRRHSIRSVQAHFRAETFSTTSFANEIKYSLKPLLNTLELESSVLAYSNVSELKDNKRMYAED